MVNNRLLSALLIALLAACGYCSSRSECPALEDMPEGCTCKNSTVFPSKLRVYCFGNGKNPKKIEEAAAILKKIFPANTTTLDLMQFEYFRKPNVLSSRIFEGLRTRELRIEYSNILSWGDKFGGPAFVGLENCLEELYIISSIFASEKYRGETERPAPFSLGHLQRLTKVQISGNKLYVFGKEWFGSGRNSVTSLDITANEIHAMGKEALIGLSALENLDLGKNKLEGLPEDLFDNSPSLEILKIDSNPLKFLPENVFGKIWSQLNWFMFYELPLHCDDHINWMLNVRGPRNLAGFCKTPEFEELKEVLKRRIYESTLKKVQRF